MDELTPNFTEPAQQEEEINLLEYWHTLVKHRRSILGLALVIMLLTTLAVFQMTPIYRATALIMLEAERPKPLTAADLYNDASGSADDYLRTQLEVLKSRTLAEKVTQKLEPDKNPVVDSQQHPSSPLTNADPRASELRNFAGNLDIELVRNSRVIKISYESADRELAAKIPNTLAEAYIENDLDAKVQMMQKANDWLNQRMGGLRSKLEASEADLQAYREQKNIVDIKGVVALNGVSRQLDEISSNLITARQHLAEAENAYNQVKNLKGQPPSAYESIPAVIKSPLFQQAKETETKAERTVNELKERYGSLHPKMTAAQTELVGAKASLERQIEAVVTAIEKEYEIAKANAQAAERAQNEMKAEIQNVNRKEFKFNVLQRDVDSNRQLYELFLNRAKETNVGANLQTTIARVIDPAIVPESPIKPKKSQIIVISLVLGLGLGIVFAFLFEYLDNTIKSGDDVESKLGLNMLGMLQIFENKPGALLGPERAFFDDPHSVFSESVRSLRTGVLLSTLDEPHEIIMVTSTVPEEGKTTVAINLAFALGQMKKVLLLDADLRHPSIGKILGGNPSWPSLPDALNGNASQGPPNQARERRQPSLPDALKGSASLSDCIRGTGSPNLFVLPSRKLLVNPLELLSSKRFEEILVKLKEQFEIIVIDCPPVKVVSDSLVLSKHASAVIYVVKADKTPRPLVLSGIKRLLEVNAPLLGVVLNQVDLKKAEKYGSYENNYHNYYSTDQEASERAEKPPALLAKLTWALRELWHRTLNK